MNTIIAPASAAFSSTLASRRPRSRTRVKRRMRTRCSGNCRSAARTTRSAVSPVESLTTKMVGRSISRRLARARGRERYHLLGDAYARPVLASGMRCTRRRFLALRLGLDAVGLAPVLTPRLACEIIKYIERFPLRYGGRRPRPCAAAVKSPLASARKRRAPTPKCSGLVAVGPRLSRQGARSTQVPSVVGHGATDRTPGRRCTGCRRGDGWMMPMSVRVGPARASRGSPGARHTPWVERRGHRVEVVEDDALFAGIASAASQSASARCSRRRSDRRKSSAAPSPAPSSPMKQAWPSLHARFEKQRLSVASQK